MTDALAEVKETLPSGFIYVPNYVTSDLADRIMKALIDLPESDWAGVSSSATSRRVLHYGWTYGYRGTGLTIAPAIPDQFAELLVPARLANHQQLSATSFAVAPPDQLIIDRYLPDQGIAPHVDDTRLFGDAVACITLGSGCEIIFMRKIGDSTDVFRHYVEPGSLYMMTGQSRYEWAHSIASVKSDLLPSGNRVKRGMRISLTYRHKK